MAGLDAQLNAADRDMKVSIDPLDSLLDGGPPKSLRLIACTAAVVLTIVLMWLWSIRYSDSVPVELTIFSAVDPRTPAVCLESQTKAFVVSSSTKVGLAIGYLSDQGSVRVGNTVRVTMASVSKEPASSWGTLYNVSSSNNPLPYTICVAVVDKSIKLSEVTTPTQPAVRAHGKVMTQEQRLGANVFRSFRSTFTGTASD